MYQYHEVVEFEDVDSYGIIHHPKILYYLERARARFLVECGFDINAVTWGVVIKSLSVNYKGKLEMFDKIIVEVRCKDIEKFRFNWDYVIKKDDKVVTTANVEMITVDKTTKSLIPLPAELVAMIETIKS